MTIPTITRHAAYLFYPFSFDATDAAEIIEPLKARTLADLLPTMNPPPGLSANPSVKASSWSVWKEKEDDKNNNSFINQELHVYLRRLFGLTDNQPDSIAYRPLQLSAECCNLLTGGWGTDGAGLTIKLGNTAALRLGWRQPDEKQKQDYWLPLKISNASLYCFPSGIGIVLLHLEYGGKQPVTTQLLLEGNYLCCRTQKKPALPLLHWVQPNATPQSIGLTLLDLIRQLAPCAQHDPDGLPITLGSKLFSYTVARFTHPWPTELADECLAFTYRLSRKYTSAYQTTRQHMQQGLFQPFEHVRHAIGLEGGATVIEISEHAGQPIQFLQNFDSDQGVNAYLPLTLLAYQEYCLLISLSQSTYRPLRYGALSTEDREQLEHYQHRLLDYRLNQRFSHASRNDLHNSFYDGWRQALALDRMLQEVTQDVNEVTQYLNYKLSQRAEELNEQMEKRSRQVQKKWERLNRLYSRFGIVFGAAVLFTGIFGMNFKPIGDGLEWCSPWVWGSGIGMIVIIFILLFLRSRIESKVED